MTKFHPNPNLPKRGWYVQDDGSQLFRDTVVKYLNIIDPSHPFSEISQGSNSYFGLTSYGVSFIRPNDGKLLNKYTGLTLKAFIEAAVIPSEDPFLGLGSKGERVFKVETYNILLPTLPESWCVRDDNSQYFRDTVVAYLNTVRLSNGQISYSKHPTGSYDFYGITKAGACLYHDTTVLYTEVLTISDFLKLRDNTDKYQKATQPTSINNNHKNVNNNHGQINSAKIDYAGTATVVPSKKGTIRTGKRQAGTTISGRRRSSSITVGHLSNTACIVTS